MQQTVDRGKWAVVLGASSGFGAEIARELARSGWNICGVHLDRKSALPGVQALISQIEATGHRALFYNVNAADAEQRAKVLEGLRSALGAGSGGVGVLVHSLAFGTLRPFIGSEGDRVTEAQMDMTLAVMAHSLVYWTQDLVAAGLLGPGARVFAMTSSGGHRVIPAYGAVSAAKAALESHFRQLAFELAPRRIAVNAVRAGVTETPALQKIPGHEHLIEGARLHNPSGRLTTPEDVAGAVAALCDPRTAWITGNVIGVDGGEDIVG